MKKIAISKLSEKLQDSIIKEVKGAISINYEEASMSKSKMPEWFKDFAKEVFTRLDRIELRLDRIENTPTMKRELLETYK